MPFFINPNAYMMMNCSSLTSHFNTDESICGSPRCGLFRQFISAVVDSVQYTCSWSVFGCPTMLAPPGAHVISVDADRVMLRCNDSRDVSWTMTCRDSQWIVAAGDVTGTCPRTPAVASLSM